MKDGVKDLKIKMYSPRELEGEVDHSFFDSDCDGDENENQDQRSPGAKQQDPASDLPLYCGVPSNKLSNKDRLKQADGGSKQLCSMPLAEGAALDLKPIQKAVSEIVDLNKKHTTEASSEPTHVGVFQSMDGKAEPARGDKGYRKSPAVTINEASSLTCRQRPSDVKETESNNIGGTAYKEKKSTPEKGDETKRGPSVLTGEERHNPDGVKGHEDSREGQSQSEMFEKDSSIPGASSLPSLPSKLSRSSGEDAHPPLVDSSSQFRTSSVNELDDYDDDLDDDDALDAECNEDGYQRSSESGEGSDEERPPEPPPPKHKTQRAHSTSRKSSAKFRQASPRPSSSSELESSSCSDDGSGSDGESCPRGSSPEHSPLRIASSGGLAPLSSSQSHRRKPQQGRERVQLESEDTVTDVTPLSTPDMSPAQSFELPVFLPETKSLDGDVAAEATAQIETFTSRVSKETEQHCLARDLDVTISSGPNNSENLEEEGVFNMEADEPGSPSEIPGEALNKLNCSDHEGQSRVSSGRQPSACSVGSSHSSGSQRRNFSFRNDEVWRIDRENQRLLRALSRPSPRSRSGSASTARSAQSVVSSTISGSSHRSGGPTPPPRLYHSAINRQREQKRIERENLAFLKRLESVKPSKGITRDEQLADYQRQARYLCTPLPSSTIEHYQAKLEASLSRASPGKGSRPYSATGVRLSPRPASRSTPSPTLTNPRLGTTPRPAWS